MTTNQDRALRLLNDLAENQDDGVGVFDAVTALADAGLLTPDLPEPNHADEDGTLEWNIPDPEQPYQGIVRLYPNGNIRLVQINAPIKDPTTALALSRALAASAYIQTHQEKK
ncbi:MAG: hypothetical protein PHW63_09860 [Alphaproteobacteria bacterium]|nr:hypothetical protein [Alphaproteobacteria bacterium]